MLSTGTGYRVPQSIELELVLRARLGCQLRCIHAVFYSELQDRRSDIPTKGSARACSLLMRSQLRGRLIELKSGQGSQRCRARSRLQSPEDMIECQSSPSPGRGGRCRCQTQCQRLRRRSSSSSSGTFAHPPYTIPSLDKLQGLSIASIFYR